MKSGGGVVGGVFVGLCGEVKARKNVVRRPPLGQDREIS
jgi:hypothetical protein